jgi:hypothetical protein
MGGSIAVAKTRKTFPWNEEERALLSRLKTPLDIQAFVNTLSYHGEITCRSPRRVMRDLKAHCFEGAMFAAAAMEWIGEAPVLVDLGSVRDDTHVLTLIRRRGCFGAIAQSNFTGLRFREPVYRTLRELVMSYFDDYFNTLGERTLRSYSLPFRLSDRIYKGWRVAEEDLDPIGDRLDAHRHIPLLTPAQEAALTLVDEKLLQAGLMGSCTEGLKVVG